MLQTNVETTTLPLCEFACSSIQVQTHGRKLKGMMLGLFGNCHAILLGKKNFSNVVYFPSFIKREREGEKGVERERVFTREN